jgi:cytoskeletal protein CcmA (bactofilin family)
VKWRDSHLIERCSSEARTSFLFGRIPIIGGEASLAGRQMFSKIKGEKKLTEIETIIGKGTTVEGTINVDACIRIDGKVYGDIKCSGDVTVGKEGYVENSITARNLFIVGKIKGTIKVENKVHIYDSGHFEGSAEMGTIVIDENGFFHGESRMKGPNNVSNFEEEAEKVKAKVKAN